MTYYVYRRAVMEILLVVFVSILFSIVGWNHHAKAAEIPVSQGKSAFASSVTSATYSADQAVDGFIQTKWTASSLQLPQWLTVDLAQNVHVKRVETVFEHAASSYQYTIETSADGINWSLFADQSSNSDISFPYYSDSGDVQARFVRIQVLGVGTPGDGASIYDFRVYTSNTPLMLLSLNKTTAAYSSFSTSLGSSKAVDGQLSTRWAPSNVSLPQWLVVDLGQLLNVQRFETTYEKQDEVYGYKIDFSVDGLTWYTFTDRTSNSQRGEPRYVDAGNVTARYFRLTTTSVGTAGTYANVAEFQIYGPDGGTTPGNQQILNSIALDRTSYSVQTGQTSTTRLTGTYSNSNSQSITSGAIYSISNTAIATVNTSGVITGVSAGTTNVTVSYMGKTTTSTVTVSTTLANLNRIAFDTYSYSMQIGAYRYPYVTAYLNDGSTQTISSGITFVSSNPSVATVNSSGSITAVTSGSANITASYGSFTASATVYVTTTVSRIEADASYVNMELNATKYVVIRAYDANNTSTTVTSSASFVSSNPSVVYASSSGYLSASSAGTATITVTYSGISTTIYVTVGALDSSAPTWNYGSSVTSSEATATSTTLTWTSATDNVGITSYRVYKGSNVVTTVSGSELSATITGLTEGQDYQFKVEAGDLANNWSTTGPSVNVSLKSAPVAPLANTAGAALSSNLVRENSPEGGLLSRVTVDADRLATAFQSLNSNPATLLTLHVQDYKDTTVIQFPTSSFNNLQVSDNHSVIRVELDANSLSIPLLFLKNHAVEGDGFIRVLIRHDAGPLAAQVSQKMTELNASLLLTNPIEFEISVNGSDLNGWDGNYVERTLALPGTSYAANATAVRIDATTGESSFVPSQLMNVGGSWSMLVKDQSGGIYTAISAAKSFADMSAHWAREDVEKLASKGIISGVSGDKFDPEKEISRAEFAALLIRSQGMKVDNSEPAAGSAFRDILKGDWYAGLVNTAAQAGLIQGYDDGTFRPSEHVSREQMAAMVNRTIQRAGQSVVSASAEAVLTPFKDHDVIDDWAREAMAFTLENGLMQGITETKLEPHANATRAQAAVMLNRLLVYMHFIN
ncbi:discoidin domain-containing protein [Paenibacillus sp. HWE-109]|uniref:discoidin domain-containing protein n=1 Tax=Paenibacillus sp. HWE-109 TaxID=1306526 RepID=UPI001EE052EA|nr:discoidin domain-containing protein [Paenibacillus sp. HWE-109]UKS28999.1 discoidin domain-containing protein [Paenibacillus sp. HWE-109]